MIDNIKDLKSRTLVESNILKSLILGNVAAKEKPVLDDILIHDYQIASATTLNTIFLNYLSDLALGWRLLGELGDRTTTKFIKVIYENADLADASDASVLLDVPGDVVVPYSASSSNELETIDIGNIQDFVNLDSIWYGISRNPLQEEGDDGKVFRFKDEDGNEILVDQLVVFSPLNSSDEIENPFDQPLEREDSSEEEESSFNQIVVENAMKWAESVQVNCIIENKFFGNPEFDEVGLKDSRYLVCLSHRFYGLIFKSGKGSLIDLGAKIDCLDGYEDDQYVFEGCGFVSIEDKATMILSCRDSQGFSYLYINEDTLTKAYGYTKIDELVSDQQVFKVGKVFSEMKSIKSLSTVNVVLTDYGFWDIEPNTTNSKTYCFSGAKTILPDISDADYHWTGKLIPPWLDVGNSKVAEYNKVLDNVDSMWRRRDAESNDYDDLQFLNSISDKDGLAHNFVGGNENFALYDGSSNSSIYILAKLELELFKKMLFSRPTLTSPLIGWLFDKVTVDDPRTAVLQKGHRDYVRFLNQLLNHDFNNLTYAFQDNDHLSSNLGSVESLISDKSSLQSCCQELYNLVSQENPNQNLNWLVQSDGELKQNIRRWFAENEFNQAKKSEFVDGLVENLTNEFPILKWFKSYLKEKLLGDIQVTDTNCQIEVKADQTTAIIKSVLSFIKSRVNAALVIGGYNGNYPGMDSYIKNSVVSLQKAEVQNVFSIPNVVQEALKAVQSAKFFDQQLDYNGTNRIKDNVDLFKVTQNVDFVKESELVDAAGNLKVDWDDLKGWLFDSDEQSQENLLKAFVRTQIYRPLYFNPTKYEKFTDPQNESIYKCDTIKSFIDHNRVENPLVLNNGAIDKAGSGLNDVSGVYEISDATYDAGENKVSYNLNYEPIGIVKDKFVFEEVQYYVADDGHTKTLNFNEFQKEMMAEVSTIDINDNKFTFKSKEYTIDGNVLKVNATEQFAGEYVQELVEGKYFTIEGVWYVLEKQNGQYASVKYAKVDDNLLKSISISNNEAEYEPWGLTFKFNGDEVQIVKHVETPIIDRVTSEWCAFDNVNVQIDTNHPDQTFDWYLANLINSLQAVGGMTALGNGNLYSGSLDVNNASIGIVNEVSGGYVVTRGVLNIGVSKQDIGVLFDKSGEIPAGKKVIGDLTGNLINEELTGKVFILKDVKKGKNNCNSAWVSQDSFPSEWWDEVGHIVFQGEDDDIQLQQDKSAIIEVEWNDAVANDMPKFLTLTPIFDVDDFGEPTDLITGYYVDVNKDGSGRYAVGKVKENRVDVVVDGVRFWIDVNPDATIDGARKIKKLNFNLSSVSTMDFSTQYGYDQLMESLLQNIRQYMLNEVVQALIENGTKNEITLNPRLLMSDQNSTSLYLDLFSDNASAQNYKTAREVPDDAKFREVFKNNLMDIDSSKVEGKNLHGCLKSKIDATFTGTTSSISIVNSPTFNVQRSNQDTFTYSVVFDLDLQAKKSGVSGLSDGEYTIGNAKVKDLVCDVVFTPTFSFNEGMKYDVQYIVRGEQNYQAEYDQIIYQLNGKKRQKSIPTKPVSFVFQGFNSSSNSSSSKTVDQLVQETVFESIKNLVASKANNILEAISSSVQSPETLVVEIQNLVNPYEPDETWQLDGSIPTLNGNETLVDDKRGSTIIYGQTYNVNEDDDKLIGEDDEQHKYNIVDVQVNVSPTSDDGQWSGPENKKVIVEKAESIDSLTSKFDIVESGDHKYLENKNEAAISKSDFIIDSVSYWMISSENEASIETETNIGKGLIIGDRFEMVLTEQDFLNGSTTSSTAHQGQPDEYQIVTSAVITKPFDLDGSIENPEWVGKVGSCSITFTLDFSTVSDGGIETFTAKIVNSGISPCYEYTKPGENEVKDITIETPIGNREFEFEIDETIRTEPSQTPYIVGYDDGDHIKTYDLSQYNIVVKFSLPVNVKSRKIASIPGSGNEYVDYGLHVKSGGTIKSVVEVLDFDGNQMRQLTDGFVNLKPIYADAPDKTLYIKLNGSQTGFYSENGYASLFETRVLPPDKQFVKDGDIFDRYYMIERSLTATFKAASYADSWIDVPSTKKSIRRQIGNPNYKTHLQANPVPISMQTAIEELVQTKIALSDDDIKDDLSQLETFLTTIQSELTQTLDSDSIKGLLKFNCNVSCSFSQYNESNNLFETENVTYKSCNNMFLNHLQAVFASDFSSSSATIKNIEDRDYYNGLRDVNSNDGIIGIKEEAREQFNDIPLANKSAIEEWNDVSEAIPGFLNLTIQALHLLMGSSSNGNDLLYDIYEDIDAQVRHMNTIPTTIMGEVKGMFVANDICNMLVNVDGDIGWYSFDASSKHMQILMENKQNAGESKYEFVPTQHSLDYAISSEDDWVFRMASRSLYPDSDISDAFIIQCVGGFWYLSPIDVYLKPGKDLEFADMAYEQTSNALYVAYRGDTHIYRYDGVQRLADEKNQATLTIPNADMKLSTNLSASVTKEDQSVDWLYLDYPEEGDKWRMTVYGKRGSVVKSETWGSPFSGGKFDQYNDIVFGDTLFNEDQLRFQNISKAKDMYDILDVEEIDGCYYGLYEDDRYDGPNPTYTLFKILPEGGIVQRLPYRIVSPQLYRTSDMLYSLYVAELSQDDNKIRLHEVSVPDTDYYPDRIIELQSILEERGLIEKDEKAGFGVKRAVMSSFNVNQSGSSFHVLSNIGFYRVRYAIEFNTASIDDLTVFKETLKQDLLNEVIGKHLEDFHNVRQKEYFDLLSSKINQFSEKFDAFDLIPTEFSETQDVGVIPDSKIDDLDEGTDHRGDAVQTSTDILLNGGMVAGSETNPGIVTAAVSNPATIYDDDNVFVKSQRNPLVEGTEFYDYIYDVDGNTLMDLYAIPFIYTINSNNTYDLYINIPTTRTKYINRIAGTLRSDLASQVGKDDFRARLNFGGESLPNNLDESTTRLKVFIDRKYISVGNVELVEICGNSIPLQIYRDPAANDGLYDSIALESRWNGEIEEIVQPEKDINKVALEFECYGTDSQSIHISGKTLIHHSLDDAKYQFS